MDGYSLEAILTALYLGLLGRAPDEEGLRHHVEKAHADGLAEVVREIAGSPEALERSRAAAGAEPTGTEQADAAGTQEHGADLVEQYLEAWD